MNLPARPTNPTTSGAAPPQALGRPAPDHVPGSSARSGNGAPATEFASPPAITLPPGGGAIRGIGEKFTANPVTGTGSVTVPLATSPARAGSGRDADAGLRLRARQRAVRAGLAPVPARDHPPHQTRCCPATRTPTSPTCSSSPAPRTWSPRSTPTTAGPGAVLDEPDWARGYRVDRYRPRIEGLFARIERWTATADGTVHWRSITPRQRHHPLRRRRPLPHRRPGRSRAGVQLADLRDLRRPRQRHGLRLQAGQRRPRRRRRLTSAPAPTRDERPTGTPSGSATATARPRRPGEDLRRPHGLDVRGGVRLRRTRPRRPDARRDRDRGSAGADPFSDYRPGFEVRTYRLCQRVLMFHHFPDEAGVGADCLVRSTDLTYTGADPTTRRAAPEARRPPSSRPSPSAATDAPDGGYLSRALPAGGVRLPARSTCTPTSPTSTPTASPTCPPGSPPRRPLGRPGRRGHRRGPRRAGREPGPTSPTSAAAFGRRARPAHRSRRAAVSPTADSCSTSPATGTSTWSTTPDPARGSSRAPTDGDWAAVPPVRVAATPRLGRPRPAVPRPGRRRAARRAGHRGRRVHLVPLASPKAGSGPRNAPCRRRRRARPAAWCSPTPTGPCSSPTCPATASSTSSESATARSATGRTSATAGSGQDHHGRVTLVRHARRLRPAGSCTSPTSTAPAPPTWSTSATAAPGSGSTRPGNAFAEPVALPGVPPVDRLTAITVTDLLGDRHRLPGLVVAAARRRAAGRCATSTSPAGPSRTCSSACATTSARRPASATPRRPASTSQDKAAGRPGSPGCRSPSTSSNASR